MSLSYQPTCSIDALKARAKLYSQIRQFFAERDVMEVETPIVSQAGVTDVHLASVQALRHINGKLQTQYLQTSPEFAMKRLLASGSGPIYQICKVFRDDEHGRKHNSEFSMLE
ncbi:amino acid--tRNA ligase-related protein, partial [Acinetobacter baumannii]